MTNQNQNNAAQAAINSIPATTWWHQDGYAVTNNASGQDLILRADAIAALSKLRAEGVQAGDEREAFETKFPVPVHCQWIGSGYAATEYHAWDAHKHKSRWEGWQARAALASAPVAGKVHPVAWRVTHPRCPKPGWQDAARETAPTRDEVKQQDQDLVLELAYAAPQASEAVRNSALEEAARQCEDIYSWRGAFSAGTMHQNVLNACASAIRTLKRPQAGKGTPLCTCPSGDGSLRHPCAAHQPSATQPEQGERDA